MLLLGDFHNPIEFYIAHLIAILDNTKIWNLVASYLALMPNYMLLDDDPIGVAIVDRIFEYQRINGSKDEDDPTYYKGFIRKDYLKSKVKNDINDLDKEDFETAIKRLEHVHGAILTFKDPIGKIRLGANPQFRDYPPGFRLIIEQ